LLLLTSPRIELMKRSKISQLGLFLTLLVSLIGSVSAGKGPDWPDVLAAVRAEFPTVKQLSPPQFSEWLKDEKRAAVILLDVRSKEEYEISHISGARRFPPGTNASTLLTEVEKEHPIVTYCSVGYRSAEMAERLQSAGFTQVYNLEGSIFAWVNQGYPVVKGGKRVYSVHPLNVKWGSLLNKKYRSTRELEGGKTGLAGEMQNRKRWAFYLGLFVLLSWESYAPFMFLFRKNLKERAWHGLKNLILGAINAAVIAICFIILWAWAAHLAAIHKFGLLNWLSLSPWAHVVGAVILFDIWTYWFHRLSHELPFFWRFHRVHHSDPKMDVTTANRFHVGEIILSSLLRTPTILIFGVTLWELFLYELIMFPIVQFHHANIGLSKRLDKLLRIIIVTPAMHKVHHSRMKCETNSNYTSLLSVWDRIFGTFRLRGRPEEISYGLDEFVNLEHQNLKGLITTPVINVETTQED
jgi:sterol desaturase/sphingolipid hydroxylase (fatty acid hydroxylase superfamily)/rhodanese-related sulfurtransferase